MVGIRKLERALTWTTWLYRYKGTDYEFSVGSAGKFKSAAMQADPRWWGVRWRVISPGVAEFYRADGAKVVFRFNDELNSFKSSHWDGTPVEGRRAELQRVLVNTVWRYTYKDRDYEFTLTKAGEFKSATMQVDPNWWGVRWRVVSQNVAELYRPDGAKIVLRFNDSHSRFACSHWDGTKVRGRLKPFETR